MLGRSGPTISIAGGGNGQLIAPVITPQQAAVAAALVVLERMGLSPADPAAAPASRPTVPTFAEYVPVVSALGDRRGGVPAMTMPRTMISRALMSFSTVARRRDRER